MMVESNVSQGGVHTHAWFRAILYEAQPFLELDPTDSEFMGPCSAAQRYQVPDLSSEYVGVYFCCLLRD